MEFLVEFEVEVPAGTAGAEVEHHQRAESAAVAKLSEDGHLVRLWGRPVVGDGTTAIGLYRADSEAELDGLLAALPLADWLHVTVTPLEEHPKRSRDGLSISALLPEPAPEHPDCGQDTELDGWDLIADRLDDEVSLFPGITLVS